MALHYQTEYRLGKHGRVCRSYTGFQAFVAIAFDLVFGLCFELVFSLTGLAAKVVLLTVRLAARMLQLYWRILVAAMTLVVYLVTLPFVWVHQAVNWLLSQRRTDQPEHQWGRESMRKPDWAFSREV
jgi:hypothetical protein